MSSDLRKKKSDYLLELALEEQMGQDMELEKYRCGNKQENPHVFSENHNRRMRRIFKMADKAEKQGRRLGKHYRIAAGLLLALCISMVLFTQVEAFRLPAVHFFMEIKEKSTMFGVKEKMEQNLTEHYKDYEPRYVPEGFAVKSVNEVEGKVLIGYLNEQKQQEYKFCFFENPGNLDADTEKGITKQITIHGCQAYVIQKGEEIRIIMDKSGKRFYLSGTVSYEEAVKVMESIK